MNQLEKQKCLKAAKIARRWAEQNRKSYFPEDLGGMCGIASVVLWRLLRKNGIRAKIALAECHAFVLYKGIIIDVTATQFGGTKVMFREYTSMRNGDWWEVIETFNSDKKFIASQKEWYSEQRWSKRWEKKYKV